MAVSRKKHNNIKSYNNEKLKVGFINGATYPDGESVANVAFENEYGTNKIPPRPFMRSTVSQNKEKWVKNIKALVQNKDTETALLQTGEMIKGDFVYSILNWDEPPNSAMTIKKKGFNKPLVDTGLMSRSISYELESDSE